MLFSAANQVLPSFISDLYGHLLDNRDHAPETITVSFNPKLSSLVADSGKPAHETGTSSSPAAAAAQRIRFEHKIVLRNPSEASHESGAGRGQPPATAGVSPGRA